MSEKKFEECTLEDATHVEVSGKVYKIETDGIAQIVLGSEDKTSFPTRKVGIVLRIRDGHWHRIFADCFPILGIKPLKEVKPKPIEFEAVFVKYDGQWRQLLTIDDGISIQNCKVAKFKCVEILEDEE